ncbi:MAG: glycosyltransferase family 2 protein [Bacteroidales bacterium]|nr:glycosyltransferase family 2 protein [Bacteroidales bacterium]
MSAPFKVSVISPFYKVAPFIERCAESLLEQTLEDVEFIFVDDASPDESRELLEKVIARHPERDARIVTHEANKGLPAARNTGLAVATGEFIFHCDSDDWVETDMLEKMYKAAADNGADYVYCDFWMQFEKSARYMVNPTYTDPEQMVKEGFMAGLMKYNVWNKIAKRSLYEESDIRFPAGHGMGEDMTMILLATNAKRVAHVSEALYHYVKLNANAFSNTFSERHLTDIRFNTDRTLKGLESWDVSDKDLYINLFKLNIKLPFLFSGDKQQYKLWKEWFPESNAYVCKNRLLPFRTKLVQWFAAKGLFPLVSLYGFLVNKVYYRLKFRV